MSTALQRLLKHPHAAVFDKAPHAELAFTLGHPDGAAWKIADGVMLAVGGGDDFEYQLRDLTVWQLVEALQDDGFTVDALATSFNHYSALVLVEGEGDHGQSNGDHIYAFTSLLWALLSGYAVESLDAKYAVTQALRQMVIGTSEGEWLDLWGTLYAAGRNAGEADSAYAVRIPKEAFRVRVNALGIEQAILDATGYDVRIAEPWREIFQLDASTLSGPHKLYDGANVGYHLIRPETRQNVDWDSVYAVINRNRAAGVMVLQSRVTHGSHIDASGNGVADMAYTRESRVWLKASNDVLLDWMDISDVPILNHPARHLRIMMHLSEVIVDQSNYAATGAHYSTYRVYPIGVEYVSQFWRYEVTWAGTKATWDTSSFISSRHTRTS